MYKLKIIIDFELEIRYFVIISHAFVANLVRPNQTRTINHLHHLELMSSCFMFMVNCFSFPSSYLPTNNDFNYLPYLPAIIIYPNHSIFPHSSPHSA